MNGARRVFKKGAGFQAGVAFDAVALALVLSLALAGVFGWILVNSARLGGQARWESVEMWVGAALCAMPLCAMPLGLAVVLHGMWTGRWGAAPSVAPTWEMSRVESLALTGKGALASAWMGATLAVGLPLGVMGEFGARLPLAVATPLSYAAGAIVGVLGMMAFVLGLARPDKSVRWLSTALFCCALALFMYPDLWTPKIWNCFPGIQMVEEAPLR